MDDPHRREVMRLAMEHRAQLWGMLMGLSKDPLKAEDLFQNTYLVICEKWEQFQPGTSFLAWARAIARFEFLASVDPARRRMVTAEAEVLEAALAAVEQDTNALSAEREALNRCLSALSNRGRSALELRYGDGLDCGQVATRLGLSQGALYVLLTRTRQALQFCIEKRLRAEAPGG